MRKLLLINPAPRNGTKGLGHTVNWKTPPLGLAYIAAATPNGWDVRIVDEFMEDVPLDYPADLVGVTTYTCTACRAYDLSNAFHKRGIPVVLGGPHVTVCAGEATRYADVVVTGEAERVWPQVIEDFVRGRLKSLYSGSPQPPNQWLLPRRDLYPAKYKIDVVQTSRGCPYTCDFCSVPVLSGHQYRQRPVAEVLDELETIEAPVIYFVDDNLIGSSSKSQKRADELFRGMVNRNIMKIWAGMTSVDVVSHPGILAHAYKSGCRVLFLGIESVCDASLVKLRKTPNIVAGAQGVRDAIDLIHSNGIAVAAGIMFGHDGEDADVFRRTLGFINATGIDIVDMSVLTPLPGTPLFKRLSTEERLLCDDLPGDWDKFDLNRPVFRLQSMEPEELERGMRFLATRLFSRTRLLTGGLRTLLRTGSVRAALLAYRVNRSTASLYAHVR